MSLPVPAEGCRRYGVARWRGVVSSLLAVLVFVVQGIAGPARARGDIDAKRVVESIDRGKRFLVRSQNPDGSWSSASGDSFRIGITSLSILALVNSGLTIEDPSVSKGVKYLRELKAPPQFTYDISLMIMALAAVKDGQKDKALVLKLVQQLEKSQIAAGEMKGCWSYGGGRNEFGGDRSNGQFAVLGLREAQELGVPVSLETWRRAREHWRLTQNGDGGWGYSGGRSGAGSIGSMTVAGIATLTITEAMIRSLDDDLDASGSPICCVDRKRDDAIEKGIRWLGQNYSISTNPHSGIWPLYYLYGLERAGRLSGRRFFGTADKKFDWYREGAAYLVSRQILNNGTWRGMGSLEADPVVGTSLALLFLSKGLAPVLVNKLQYTDPAGVDDPLFGDWNRFPNDIRNLTQHISGLPLWPKLVTWQVVELPKASSADLMQAPVLFISGSKKLDVSFEQVALLKEYVSQGGFIYFERSCASPEFDTSVRELVKKMYAEEPEAVLKELSPDHAIYRSEYLLDASTVKLWGVEVGCRTSLVYSPYHHACLWDKWTPFDYAGEGADRNRRTQLKLMVAKSLQVGVNVIAYATGREPPNKLDQLANVNASGTADKIERGFLQVAKLRTEGTDPAPRALKNLLLALNKTVGGNASTKTRDIASSDPNLLKYPLVYMHGREAVTLQTRDLDHLRKYLENGGVLFADACCGAPQFDRGFRQMVAQLFPKQSLKRIPPDHEIFTSNIGYDLKSVKRRESTVNKPGEPLKSTVRDVEPLLEGIEINGRFVVIYSKFDISCALERQAAVECTGYIHEDAVRLGVNVILYAMLQ